MNVIEVDDLTKIYNVFQKEPGFGGTLRSLLRRRYKKIRAVDNVSFKIQEGELVGFIGPNGAGKTTTLKMLSGLLYPTSGDAKVLGFVPWERNVFFQKQFAFVAGQKNQLWWDLPAYETFLLNKEIYEVSDSDFRERISYFSKMLGIGDLLNVQVKKLSLGQRMKAELVAALLHRPKVLFLDEPTIGLDIIAQKKMHDFIKNYNEKFGASIILTSHYMGDVEKLCKRVIIINKGIIVYDGWLSKVTQKFTRFKVASLFFEKEVSKNLLEKYGNVINYEPFAAKIEIERDKVVQSVGAMMGDLPVVDLSIEEIPIEEVISQIFAKSR